MIVNFIIPGDIDLPTGGYRYDKRILQEWRKLGISANLVSLEGEYPFPNDGLINKAISRIQDLSAADISIVDGLAGGAMPNFMRELSTKSPAVALIHHPLCLENGLSESERGQLRQAEKEGLEHVSGVVTTSPTTSKTVEEIFQFSSRNIATVTPGVERGLIAKPHTSGPIRLLCIGSLIERKGHRYLIEALSNLAQHNWILDCFGLMNEYSAHYREISGLIHRHGLQERITLHGSVSDERIEKAYSESHLFVLPSLFEGYGMAYAEAIVRGLPVIGTTAGAIPETVPNSCGILVEAGDSSALHQALEQFLTDRKLIEKYRSGSLSAASDFPTWQGAATTFKNILEQML